MRPIINFFLDFIFPPTKESIILRSFGLGEMAHLSPAEDPPFHFVRSLYSYKDPLAKELIREIKYKKDEHCINLAASALNREISGIPGRAILIPIPISKKRRRERGFNQCELIVDKICLLNPEKFIKRLDILSRTKDSGEQKFKDKKGRLQAKDIFSAKFFPVDCPIIIIDDVTTTGATLKEAREALLKVGYLEVNAFTVAH